MAGPFPAASALCPGKGPTNVIGVDKVGKVAYDGPMANVWRQTKRGEWAVMGPVEAITAGATVTVTKKDGTTSQATIARVGKPFERDGTQMVYGYPADNASHSRECGEPHRGHCCKTGGQCSSFGSGRSCGAYCCDGY